MKINIFKIMQLLLALILFNSCERDEYELCEETAYLGSSFIIGHDNDCMDINMNPPPFVDAHYRYVELDIDNDGVIDFKIQKYKFYDVLHLAMETIDMKGSTIGIENASFQISVIEMPDTVRRCMDTTYPMAPSQYYNNYSNYSCSGEDRKDTIFSTSIISYPIVYSKGDSITQKELWQNGGFTLAYNDNSPRVSDYFDSYSIIRGTWLGSQNSKYILFRKESGGAHIYGWLKLSISSFSNVFLQEYAIQRRSIE